MTPEATALVERLVVLVLRSNHPDSDGPELDLSGRPECVRFTTVMGSLPDLDHPSNEGHLRALAEKVFGRKVWARWTGDGWAVMGVHDAFPQNGAHVIDMAYPTPGQAYAAAIVAALEEA